MDCDVIYANSGEYNKCLYYTVISINFVILKSEADLLSICPCVASQKLMH